MINAGVTRIIFSETYRISPPYDEAKACGVQMGPGMPFEEVTDDAVAWKALEAIQEIAKDRERFVAQGPFALASIQHLVEEALNKR